MGSCRWIKRSTSSLRPNRRSIASISTSKFKPFGDPRKNSSTVWIHLTANDPILIPPCDIEFVCPVYAGIIEAVSWCNRPNRLGRRKSYVGYVQVRAACKRAAFISDNISRRRGIPAASALFAITGNDDIVSSMVSHSGISLSTAHLCNASAIWAP